MEDKFKITGLWIPYQILTDKNLRDKEKIIYSLILFFSNNKGYCSIRNIWMTKRNLFIQLLCIIAIE